MLNVQNVEKLDQIRSGQRVEIKLKLMIKILFGFGLVKSILEELLALALIKPEKTEHKLTIMKCIRYAELASSKGYIQTR